MNMFVQDTLCLLLSMWLCGYCTMAVDCVYACAWLAFLAALRFLLLPLSHRAPMIVPQVAMTSWREGGESGGGS